jgi:acyl carrier protein
MSLLGEVDVMASAMFDDEAVRRIVRSGIERIVEPTVAFTDESDLFELGLDSILVVLLMRSIGEACNVTIPATQLYVTPNVNGIVAAVRSAYHG